MFFGLSGYMVVSGTVPPSLWKAEVLLETLLLLGMFEMVEYFDDLICEIFQTVVLLNIETGSGCCCHSCQGCDLYAHKSFPF